ncbi:MAG: hypothetical protein H7A21_12710 [Spirochaetales bacterium]|nr:hypothetical protein [Leptospiraceae bacterium]MCP5482288.1 hypothetical protein [Spirochaetales bacterium]MCP5484273.1 hypothetical protein [Spirochaetales bacterium]
MPPSNDAERAQSLRKHLKEVEGWMLPFLNVSRAPAGGRRRFATVLLADVSRGRYLVYEPGLGPLNARMGDVIQEYENLEQLLDDGWMID